MFTKEELCCLDSLPVALCGIDKSKKVFSWNRCISRWTGIKTEDSIGRGLCELFPALGVDVVEASFKQVDEKGEAVSLPCSCSENWVSGTKKNIFFKITVLENRDGENAGYLLFGTEVSCFAEKLRSCGEELKEARDHLEEVQSSKDRLTRSRKKLKALNNELYSIGYTLSHDLRAPLRHIDGFSEIVKDMVKEGDFEGSLLFLDKIQQSVGKMSSLLDSVLRLSRVMGAELMICKTDVFRAFRDVWDELKLEYDLDSFQVKFPAKQRVDADPGLIKLLAENLLENAVKFTLHRPQPEIELGCIQEAGKQVFYIRDNGCGFDPEKTDEILLPFRREANGTKAKGDGIGLSIVSKVIDRHGGSIWADSAVDQGATFYFCFESELSG